MPFQDKYRSLIYVHDGAFEGEATAYTFTVSDSATPIGGFYASGGSLAEVVLHNTSATNSILVKAKSGTVGTALNEYSGIYKLEPLESRKFIFGSDMFFALANYVSGDTATVHISALNATVTEPEAAPEGNHGPENIAAGDSYTFGLFTSAGAWSVPFTFSASGAGSVNFTILDSTLEVSDSGDFDASAGANSGAMENFMSSFNSIVLGGPGYIRVTPSSMNLTDVLLDTTGVTEP